MNSTIRIAFAVACLAAVPGSTKLEAQSPEQQVRAAVESYNRAFVGKDLPGLKALLAPDIVLYEHSVKNIGLDDVWDNHLKPEVSAFEGTKAEFSDVRVWATSEMALVTRLYAITATMNGRVIDAKGNETMTWVRRDGAWKVVHIHYSHPCPRPASSSASPPVGSHERT
jgi:ketosteroid isomerase-like protein